MAPKRRRSESEENVTLKKMKSVSITETSPCHADILNIQCINLTFFTVYYILIYYLVVIFWSAS